MAERPDAHARFTVLKDVVVGMPTWLAAMRPAFEPPSSARTVPTQTSSIFAGSRLGNFWTVAFRTYLDGQIRSTNASGKTYSTEQFVVICIAQPSLLRPCHWSSQCRKNDHIVGVLLENVLDTFLDECHCVGRKALTARLGVQHTFEVTHDEIRKTGEASGKKESRCSPRRESMMVMFDAPIWSFRQLDAGRKCCKTAAVKTSPATLGRKRLGY